MLNLNRRLDKLETQTEGKEAPERFLWCDLRPDGRLEDEDAVISRHLSKFPEDASCRFHILHWQSKG